MSQKSKKVHASKSKSRTVKKGGGFLDFFGSSSTESTTPKDESQSNTVVPSTPPPENKKSSMFGLPNMFSGLWSSSSKPENPPQPQPQPNQLGGKKRSKKSRTSKKHRKTNNAK